MRFFRKFSKLDGKVKEIADFEVNLRGVNSILGFWNNLSNNESQKAVVESVRTRSTPSAYWLIQSEICVRNEELLAYPRSIINFFIYTFPKSRGYQAGNVTYRNDIRLKR